MNLEYIAIRIDDFDELRAKAKFVDNLRPTLDSLLATALKGITDEDARGPFSEDRARGVHVGLRMIDDIYRATFESQGVGRS